MSGQLPNSPHHGSQARRLRILHVADAGIFDRFGQMLRHLVLALNGEGFALSLLTDDPRSLAAFDGLPVTSYFQPALSGWRAWRGIRRLLRQLDPPPDVVHLWGTVAMELVGNWALSQDRPVLVHLLSANDVRQVLRPQWCGRVRLLAGCQGLRRLLPAGMPLRIEQAWDFSPALLAPEQAEPQAPPENRLPGVVWAGRVEASAGLDTLIDAIAELRVRGFAVQVALIGTGPATAQVRARVRALRVRDCVSLVEEPRLWELAVAGAEFCVVPAPQQELWLAPLLAMALGRIVIASSDQIAEWFIAGQTCWQFSAGDASELAGCIARLGADPAAAQKLRFSAAAYVRQNHAIARLCESLAEAYRRVCARRRYGLVESRRVQ
jgi:glycosyltransferase involved in cell wall biosynthesis